MVQPIEYPTKLIDNKTVHESSRQYVTVNVQLQRIVESWRQSLFSFEWLDKNGQVRPPETLKDTEKSKYNSVYMAYRTGIPMERPILGLGVMDNVEIGSKKEVLLTLYSLGIAEMDVHVPDSCLKDFQKFM